MKTRRNILTAFLAISGVLAFSAAGAQVERFGRDSAYATRAPTGKTVATKILDVTRYGRDSAYATRAPTGKAVVTSTVEVTTGRYGRDSAYATRAPAKTIAVTTTAGADTAIKPGRM